MIMVPNNTIEAELLAARSKMASQIAIDLFDSAQPRALNPKTEEALFKARSALFGEMVIASLPPNQTETIDQ